MSNSSKSLEEQVKARIANCRRSQEMFLHEFREGLIDEEHYKELYGRINLRIDELEQVLSLIDKTVEQMKLVDAWEGETRPGWVKTTLIEMIK